MSLLRDGRYQPYVQSVHKALEGRIQLDAAKIEIKTNEEQWGRRYLHLS